MMLKGERFRSAQKVVKNFVIRALRKSGYQLINLRTLYEFDGIHTVHNARFRDDPKFQAAWEGAFQATGCVDPGSSWRIHIGLWAAEAAARIDGAFVECGVNAGFLSSAIVRYLDWDRLQKQFFLVDTFTGPVLSQFSSEEIARGRRDAAEHYMDVGGYVTDVDSVRQRYERWDSVIIVKGTVPEVLASMDVSKIAFLHLDMNCAFPECEALKFFWDRISAGGIVLLDDYAYFGYEAQGDAMDFVARSFGASILALPTGQGMILK
jgi:hypothetical protein